MKYYERMEYQLSRVFKNSVALGLLEYQLEKLPYSILKSVSFRDSSYDYDRQGDKIKYEIDEETGKETHSSGGMLKETGNINIVLETVHDYKKKYVYFEIKRRGNEVNIITKSPREDSFLFHIRHNSNNTVSLLSRRIKFHNREDEQILESRYALFSDNGDLLDFNEEKFDQIHQDIKGQYLKY